MTTVPAGTAAAPPARRGNRLARRGALAAAVVTMLAAPPVRAERLVAELSSRVVRITSSFNGGKLTLFGTVEDAPGPPPAGGYDVVVTVTGPRQSVVAFQKARRFGIWVNAASRTFVDVPSYLVVLSTRPLAALAPAATLRDARIGLDNAVIPQAASGDVVVGSEREDPFRRAFVRLKRERLLYDERDDGVMFLTSSLYRAGVYVPTEAPVGNYDVDVKLFAGGRPVADTRLAFEIRTVGFEHFIATAAVNHGIAYGIATALMAVLTGWLASILFRRD